MKCKKLSFEQQCEVFNLYHRHNVSTNELAKQYGVSISVIKNVHGCKYHSREEYEKEPLKLPENFTTSRWSMDMYMFLHEHGDRIDELASLCKCSTKHIKKQLTRIRNFMELKPFSVGTIINFINDNGKRPTTKEVDDMLGIKVNQNVIDLIYSNRKEISTKKEPIDKVHDQDPFIDCNTRQERLDWLTNALGLDPVFIAPVSDRSIYVRGENRQSGKTTSMLVHLLLSLLENKFGYANDGNLLVIKHETHRKCIINLLHEMVDKLNITDITGGINRLKWNINNFNCLKGLRYGPKIFVDAEVNFTNFIYDNGLVDNNKFYVTSDHADVIDGPFDYYNLSFNPSIIVPSYPEPDKNKQYQYTYTDNFVMINYADDGKMIIKQCNKSHKFFDKILSLVKEGNIHNAFEYINVGDFIVSLSDNLQINKDKKQLVFKGVPVKQHKLTSWILDASEEDRKSYVNFFERLSLNPSSDSINSLFDWVALNDIKLTETGMLIGYKAVNGDYTDKRTGTFDNSIGSIVTEDRELVDTNRNNGCGRGLHVGSYKYAVAFMYNKGDKLIKVHVDPMDVVTIPHDCDYQKVRCCEYEVVADVDV